MWSASRIFTLVTALIVPSASWVAVAPEDDAWRLVWRNGDAFPGTLLESEPGQVRWASPHFARPLVVDMAALDSIMFPDQPVEPAEAYRVAIVSGDVLVADLAGVDGEGFLLSSRRHGEVRVARDMVQGLFLQRHPNLLFDGSQLGGWSRAPVYATGDTPGRGRLSAFKWRPDAEGHPYTDKAQAEITHALDWPERFEIALEFASSERPGFVLALGRSVDRALRMETWADDLVIAQGRQFEQVLTVEEGQQEVRLRLAFDARAGVATVHDSTGLLLAELADVRPLEQNAGLIVRSRGRDLTVRQLRAYRQTGEGPGGRVDWARPRVHTIDGQAFYGRLFGDDGGAYVLAGDGTRRDVDLGEIDRVVRPDIELSAVVGPAEVTYPEGSVVRGRVEGLNGDRVALRTAFADEAVDCVLAGASRLRFGPAGETAEAAEVYEDGLFHSSGSLGGRISFDGKDGQLVRWQVAGGVSPVPVALAGGARIQRGSRTVSTAAAYDREAYPDVLRLKSREVIRSKLESADEEQVQFRSPFVETRNVDTRHVKAIEFSPGPISGNTSSGAYLGLQGSREALNRALTVPRFLRDDPPTHVLMAKTGDLLRGRLLGIGEQTVRFESKLRSMNIPISRVARVVDVRRPDDDAASAAAPADAADTGGTIRVTLADGSSLVFAPLESDDGKLSGRSPIYGVAVAPVNSIDRVRSGGDGPKEFPSVFDEWVVRPGREPFFGGDE